ncbi:MAG: hypothetical protein AAF492_13490, partial [Verrucomicrobiota bacterium]
KPDLVILQFINNDIGLPIFMMPPKNYLAPDRSFFVDLVRTRLGWLAREKGINTRSRHLFGDRHMHDWDEEVVDEVRSQYNHLAGRGAVRRALERLKELADEHGFDVLVMKGAIGERLDEMLEEQCQEHGFTLFTSGPYTDAFLRHRGMSTEKEARRKALWVSRADHHPNAMGHEIYADALMHQMTRKGIIDFKLEYEELLRDDSS